MKRFTAAEKWEKPWFQELAPHLKCLWLYMCDKADCAGVWEPNWKLASLSIGKNVTVADLPHFAGKIAVAKGGKIVIGSFIEFQYGKLSGDCRAHIPIFRLLQKHRVSIGYDEAIHSLKEKEQEEEEEKDMETEGGDARGGTPIEVRVEAFDLFWKAYPKRVAKADAEKAFAKKECHKIMPLILDSIRTLKISADWTKEAGQFIPHPATWLNREGWHDELPESNGATLHTEKSKYGF